MTAKLNLKIQQGSTFLYILRWESSEKRYCPISSLSKTAPMSLTVSGTLPPVNWRVSVSGIKEVLGKQLYVSAISAQTLEFNQIDATLYSTYTSGGVLEYNVPAPLTSVSARMQLRDYKDNLLLSLTSENGGIIISPTTFEITINIPSALTKELNFSVAKYDLELEDVTNRVIRLLEGTVALSREVTK